MGSCISLLYYFGLAGGPSCVAISISPKLVVAWNGLDYTFIVNVFHDMVNSRIPKPFLTCINSVK